MAVKPRKPSKPASRRPAPKPAKPAARKPAKPKPAASKPAKPAEKKYAKRSDLGASIDIYLAGLDGEPRAICTGLVTLIQKAAPAATSELKWGMPVFTIGGEMLCYFRVQKTYVRFGLAPGATLEDPDGVLYGSGDGKHLKLASMQDLDPKRQKQVTGWVKAVAGARA
jgi:hypothetical protein